MNLNHALLIALFPLALAACAGASDPATSQGDSVEIVPTASTSTATTSAQPVASSQPVAAAGGCPLFCAPKDGVCSRPGVPDDTLDRISCGQYSMNQLTGFAPEACPAECCPTLTAATAGKGGDKDADGILDENDKCPDAPEDRDGKDDWDGCPDPDNDGDGIKDVDDKCCYVAEDKNGKEDLDGCPDA